MSAKKPTSSSSKPWNTLVGKAQQADRSGDLVSAKKLYEKALVELKQHFEGESVKSKYYQYKYSYISFLINQLGAFQEGII